MRTSRSPTTDEPIVTRKEASIGGDKRYFTGKPCKHGHIDFRTTSNGVCMECSRIKSLKRMRENPDARRKSRECDKNRYQNDEAFRERVKERSRRWYHAKRLDPEWIDKERARRRREREEYPHRWVACYNARRGREKKAEGKVTAKQIMEILESQGRRCVYCDVDLDQGYEVDHIMPLARGGSNWPSNIQCLCRACNRRKSSKHPDDFAKEMGLL